MQNLPTVTPATTASEGDDLSATLPGADELLTRTRSALAELTRGRPKTLSQAAWLIGCLRAG